MNIDGESGGFERMLRMLRDQAGYHSRQNVSRASACHSRIAGGIHPDGAIGRSDQGAMPFEHDNQLMFASEFSRNLQTVHLNFGNAQAGQARHFSRVRGDNEGSSASVQLAG